MTTVERSGSVDAPITLVWEVLSDFGAIASWASNVDHSCLLTDSPLGVGAARRIQTGRMTVRETVKTWEPTTSMSYRISGLPPVVRSVVNTWRLQASGDSTTVSLSTEVDCGPRPPQQLIARLVGRRLAAASEQMIDGLVERCGQICPVAARAGGRKR